MNDAKEKWFSLDISVQPEAAEAVEFAFNSLNAEGIATSFRKFNQTDAVTVSGYFNELPDDQIIQDELHYALRTYEFSEESIVAITRGEVENADWLAEWKKHWKPTTIGRFVIAPPWEKLDDESKIFITIEPNMAFGTGTHNTTQLCIAEIERFYNPGDTFLDVGTGTGILAIAAAKLCETESDFFGCDTDPDSISIATENAAANSVGWIRFEVGPLADDVPQYDFVCANLTIDVILPILGKLLEKTKKTLVLSGILAEQEQQITDALGKNRVEKFSIAHSGDWISVTVFCD